MLSFFTPQNIGASHECLKLLELISENFEFIESEGKKSEEERTLSSQLVSFLKEGRFFQIATPLARGGTQLSLVEQALVIENLSQAYASAGWCVMIGSDGGYYTIAMSDISYKKLYPSPDYVTAGWIMPAGRLERKGDGFLLTGSWSFGSGIKHADVVAAGAFVGGEEESGPLVALAPAKNFEVIPETWRTSGMRGTGSCNYRADGAFIPKENVFKLGDLVESNLPADPFGWAGFFFANLAAVPLGTARRSLDEYRALVGRQVGHGSPIPVGVREEFSRLARSLHAARELYFSCLASVGDVIEKSGSFPEVERGQLLNSYNFAIQTAAEVTSGLVDLIGTSGVRDDSISERLFLDCQTMKQHLMGQSKILYMSGALLLEDMSTIVSHPLAQSGIV